ncbi:unnamed protein product [Blumeria hordei]|uniref:serine--tRNA ligase n=1 Tax=Blumeria hordei TaxID=2867405 RepID=A0A383UWB9_BLUHO|nr:unnamed protein product [Blumeria hordei]
MNNSRLFQYQTRKYLLDMSVSQRVCIFQIQNSSLRPTPNRLYHASRYLQDQTINSQIAPKFSINTKHIRQNPVLHEKNCLERNYIAQSKYPAKICSLFDEYQANITGSRALRERNNQVNRKIALMATPSESVSIDSLDSGQCSRDALLMEARSLKNELSGIKTRQTELQTEIDQLAAAIPNITSDKTPRGFIPCVKGYFNELPDSNSPSCKVWRSHVEIARELNLMDFSGAAVTSGWGWYYLLNDAVLLEQALIQYALSVVRKHGWSLVSPPSMVYSHIAQACGFQPRDQNGEQQVYNVQQPSADIGRKPQLSLTGTAEIPLASMKANQTLEATDLPLKFVGASRCYRAEAGARGSNTRGLYRVHEFTKVEMFAWTLPNDAASTLVFDEILSIQTEILGALSLPCRILEMPSTDLGASASRKCDIEAFFPSRRARDDGWGEVTSASTCTDYQTRRLATRLRSLHPSSEDVPTFPYTINGTALAIPRVLAALLENGWVEEKGHVEIPKALWPWMDGQKVIKKC